MLIKDLKSEYTYMTNAMKAIGFNRQGYVPWLRAGYIPMSSQIKIEVATNGKLKACLGHVEPYLSLGVDFKRASAHIDYSEIKDIDFLHKGNCAQLLGEDERF